MPSDELRRACCAEPGDLLVPADAENPGMEDAVEVVRPLGPCGTLTARDDEGEFTATGWEWRLWRTAGELVAEELMSD